MDFDTKLDVTNKFFDDLKGENDSPKMNIKCLRESLDESNAKSVCKAVVYEELLETQVTEEIRRDD